MGKWPFLPFVVLKIVYRYFPKVVVLLCVVAFIIFVGDFFSAPKYDDLFKGHWAGCGNYKALKRDASMFDQDVLALEIRDAQPAKFLLSGRLEVSRATYLRHFKHAKGVLVELNHFSSSPILLTSIPSWIEVERPQDRDIGDKRQITLELKKYELVDGAPWEFPFDEYRFGFTASVHVLGPGAKSYYPQPIEVVIVNTTLSNAFEVRKADTVGQFMRTPGPSSATNFREKYSNDQCALIFKRPIWYRAMILFLLTLLFSPAIYILYNPDADPGVELIAAIMGVAAIRTYFLGGFAEWNFYPVDIVFALTVLLTAIIPLSRLPKRGES